MSTKNTTSTNSVSEAEASISLHQISERAHGSSTPKPDCVNRPFPSPSNISSVTSQSGSSSSTTPRKRRPTRSESRDQRNPTPVKQHKLESMVAERLLLSSATNSLSSALSKLNVTSQQSDQSSSSTGNEPPAKIRKGGLEWSTFKPKHKDRIYEHVLNQPNDTLNEAKIWVQLYKKQARQAIINLIQFFADICGYQDFNVCAIFNYEKENYIELMNFMQENPPTYQKQTGRYLMKASSNWSKQSQNAIFGFIKDLLEIVNSTEILFDSLMLKHLLGIVITLICSHNRSMHHIGIVVVVKMNTVFLEIHTVIKEKIVQYRRNSRINTECIEEQLNVLVKYEALLCAVLEKVHGIIEKYCCTQDDALVKMEVTVLEEMFNWFKINPSLLSSTKYFRRLMTLVEDTSKNVRLAALVVCHKLIKDERMDNYLHPLIKKCVEVVVGRVYDVDYGIAAYAVEICTDMLRKYSNPIPELSRDRIMMFVYCENQQLAMAAGAFLNEIFHKYCGRNGEENSDAFIKQLITFSYLEAEDYVPLLVEAVLPHCFELRDWDTMIDLLLNGNLEFKDETKLIDIMSHAAQQTITGKSKINRSKSLQGHMKIENVRKTSHTFISKLYPLLKKYSTDLKSVQMLTEILVVIDYKDSSFSKYITEIVSIINVLRAIFVKNSNEKLLETISMILANLCEELSIFKNRATGLVRVLKEAVIEVYLTSLENLDQTVDEDSLSKMEAASLKLSVLFINHDLTEQIEHEHFNWLKLETIVTPKSTKNIITCGYWYVIWMLRKILANGSKTQPVHNLRELVYQLKSTCEEYIEACFDSLKCSENFLICREAFECICNIYVIFRKDLKNPMKSNSVLKEILPKVPENDLINLLMNFAQKLLFEDENGSTLKSRRISLGNVLNLAFLGVIPLQQLTKVYKYYHLHKDYEDILNDGLQRVRGVGAMPLAGVVLHTLAYCFTDTDVTQKEARDNLRLLAQRFQAFVSRSIEEVKFILHMGIKYAIFSENRYTFLYYLKYFIATLSVEDRKLILDFFSSLIANKNRDHEIFADFMGYFKNKQSPVQQKTLTNTSEEEDIEYDTEEDTSAFAEQYSIEDVSDAV